MLTTTCLTDVITVCYRRSIQLLLQVPFFPYLNHRVRHIVQSGQVLRLLPCHRRRAKQQVGMKPGTEDSPHYDVSQSVTLFISVFIFLAVSWFILQEIRNIVACQIKNSFGQCLLTIGSLTFIINRSLFNIYYKGT